MKNVCLALALASALVVPQTVHAQFANAVISYNTGTGFATAFTNGSAALGAPASGASVTPFAPPFSTSQIVSIGAGGEITLQLNTPILNDPSAPFGVNFILFANEFFTKSSGGTVSGLFNHAASTLVQVSPDGSTWYTLNPALAPPVGQLFPTDGSGNPQIPVNPTLGLNDFTGQTLAGIRSLYSGSAGGAGYDLAWAQDSGGNNVDLPSADFIRLEVQSGVVDLDAISITPEPSAMAIGLAGIVLLLLAHKWRAGLQTGPVAAQLSGQQRYGVPPLSGGARANAISSGAFNAFHLADAPPAEAGTPCLKEPGSSI